MFIDVVVGADLHVVHLTINKHGPGEIGQVRPTEEHAELVPPVVIDVCIASEPVRYRNEHPRVEYGLRYTRRGGIRGKLREEAVARGSNAGGPSAEYNADARCEFCEPYEAEEDGHCLGPGRPGVYCPDAVEEE